MTEAEPLKPEDLKAAMLATFEKLEQTPLLDPDAQYSTSGSDLSPSSAALAWIRLSGTLIAFG